MKKISFIHAADLHLDSPMVGLKQLPKDMLQTMRESTFTALGKITATAIEKRVDFVILAGDLFDGEDRSLKAQSRFRREMEKLEAESIPVYLIHGNHDHLNGSWVNLGLPENVHVFGSKVEHKMFSNNSGTTVHLYGFSYGQRHVIDKKINDYLKKDGADYHIGILHGHSGSDSEHGVYAPFLLKDLLEKQFDYWALGHIHKREILFSSPPVVYPGNIQGRNRKETGMKGCYHVTLTKLETKLEFVQTSEVVWEEIIIDISSAKRFQDVYQLCRTTLESIRKEKVGTLLTLILNGTLMEDVHELQLLTTELLEMLQDEEKDEAEFVWVTDITVQAEQVWDRSQLAKETEFFGELFKQADSYESIDQAIALLYEDHFLGRKYLSRLSDTEQKKIVDQAEKILSGLLNS